jgi:Rps23 Pro-64 3,4-dihydroxylase Tpa1-like proline 4-hydroxylase
MPQGPMPPWHQFRDLLGADERRMLLDWTLSQRARFKPAGLAGAGLDPERRVSDKLKDLGPAAAPFEARLQSLLPEIFARTGTRPFEVEHVELELAAHGDGAFFARHSDMPVGPGRRPLGGDEVSGQDRLVSAVYYFHREPKRFSGGALRLFRFGASGDEPADHADVEPEQNSLVVFPSWAAHEVRPVTVPGGTFEDGRFAVNAWLCRRLG